MDVEFFPTSLSDMGCEEDLREFMKETEEIYHETGMPMIPCFLHHFCLPFSPICVLCYCQSRRKSRLEDLVEDFNKEKGKNIFAISVMKNQWQANKLINYTK